VPITVELADAHEKNALVSIRRIIPNTIQFIFMKKHNLESHLTFQLIHCSWLEKRLIGITQRKLSNQLLHPNNLG
jgi:hypothetical protein